MSCIDPYYIHEYYSTCHNSIQQHITITQDAHFHDVQRNPEATRIAALNCDAIKLTATGSRGVMVVVGWRDFEVAKWVITQTF
jgi:hypothetical protein